MKRKNIIALCSAAVLSASIFATSAYAGPMCGGWKSDRMGGSGMHMGGRMIKKLDLTDEQQALWKSQQERIQNARAEGGVNPMQMHEEMHKLITADTFDDQALEALASTMSEKIKTSMLMHSKAMRELYISLSDEQKQKLEKLHEKRSHHMKKHRKD